ncbi:urea transporter [Paraburkholderia silviterrae]|uniref:Urea transporter n=1 Tax=Paraburkholderia silviterrae TaxID=2528715 RepID=A0A4R5M9K1_9BURK|nr:urea transporter [Paraburkholderia silviterrae]TDG22924.1 urea transporter [Paraburkholderia silviterrae]
MSTPAPAQADPDAAFASPRTDASASDSSPGLAGPLRTLLRSLGQIVLQRHAGTGVCVLAALALCDLRLACAALIGAATANVCARLTRQPRQAIRDGLAGFNGALAGLAAFTFVGDTVTAVALALLAAAASAWIGAPLARWLRHAGLSVYSAPCLIATWAWLALGAGGTHAAAAGALAPARLARPWLDAAAGILSGVAQTTFASGALPGLVLLAGLAWSSRRAAAYALGGAALASAIEYAFGAPPASFAAGLCGFNGALAALAASALGARAAICATMLAAALHLAAVRLGLPAMTAPFALAGWTVHGAWRLMTPARSRPQQEPAGGEAPDAVASAEGSTLPTETAMLAAPKIESPIEAQMGSPIGSLAGVQIGARTELPIELPIESPIELPIEAQIDAPIGAPLRPQTEPQFGSCARPTAR